MIFMISGSFCLVRLTRIGKCIVSGKSRYYYPYTNCITSIPVGFSWIWPLFEYVSISSVSYQSVSTPTSTDEEETYKVFKQIVSTAEDSLRSIEEISADYIDKLCRDENLLTAAGLLQLLRDKHIILSPLAYNLLMVKAGERNNIDLMSQVFKNLLVSSQSLSKTSYHSLAKAFTKSDDNVQLLRFVKEVSELAFPRSTNVVNRIIFAFADCRQIDKALLIFDQIKSLKCKPDLITYNIVLDFLGRAGRIDEMLHEFASMKGAGIVPDIVSYNTLFNNLRKVRKLDTCSVLLQEMNGNGIEPDLLTYTALIESFGRSGKIEESLRLFAEMKQRQIRPSIYIYRSLISNLKRMGKVELSMTLLEEMNSSLSNLAGPEDFKWKNRLSKLKQGDIWKHK